MSIDRNKYLGEVLHTHKLRHIEKFVKKVKDKRDEIKEVMSEHYGEKKIYGIQFWKYGKTYSHKH